MGSMNEEKPKGPYTLWTSQGYGNWTCEDFDTLEAAVLAADGQHGSAWVIQKPARFSVAELDT